MIVPTNGSTARGVTAVEMPGIRTATWGGASFTADSTKETGSRFSSPSESVNRTTSVRSPATGPTDAVMVRPAFAPASDPTTSSEPSAMLVMLAAESGLVAVQAISTTDPAGTCTIRDAAA